MLPNDRDRAPNLAGQKSTLPSSLSLEQAGRLEPFGLADGLDDVIETFQMEDVLLPGEAEPPTREEVWDDAALPPSQATQMLGRFATGIGVEQRRHQIRFLTNKALAEPPAEPEGSRPLVVPRTLEKVSDEDLADQLSAFAERIAEKTPGDKLVKLMGEGAKQFILEQLNPALQISLGVAGAARHGHALRSWGEMSGAERLVHVSGFAEGVAEVLSAVTPPPAGPAIKVLGLGMVLVKVAVERSQPTAELPAPPAAPEQKPAPRPVAPPVRGTRALVPPEARRGTGQLRMPAKPGTGPLKAPPERGTMHLKAPPPPPEQGGEKLTDLWNNLKRFWF